MQTITPTKRSTMSQRTPARGFALGPEGPRDGEGLPTRRALLAFARQAPWVPVAKPPAYLERWSGMDLTPSGLEDVSYFLRYDAPNDRFYVQVTTGEGTFETKVYELERRLSPAELKTAAGLRRGLAKLSVEGLKETKVTYRGSDPYRGTQRLLRVELSRPEPEVMDGTVRTALVDPVANNVVIAESSERGLSHYGPVPLPKGLRFSLAESTLEPSLVAALEVAARDEPSPI